MKKLLMAILMFSNITFAAEGNGSTGGGHIYGDKLNPWFLQNTETVNYCVEIAPEFGDVAEERAVQLIEESFTYWKSVFAKYSVNYKLDFNLDAKVATQEFIHQKKCDESTDIKFQLGFLTAEQVKNNPNYKQTIALAQRTSYDSSLLKGKGFIYVAPEKGEFKPTTSTFNSGIWTRYNNKALLMTVIHEMGHIFGFQDDFSDQGIMSAHFVKRVTELEFDQGFNLSHLPNPLGCNKDYDFYFKGEHQTRTIGSEEEIPVSQTLKAESLKDFLGLPDNFTMITKGSDRKITFEVDGSYYGSIELGSNVNYMYETRNAVSLYLTHEQRVFLSLPKEAFDQPWTIYMAKVTEKMKYKELNLHNGKKLDVFLNFNDYCQPTVGTVRDNDVIFNIFSSY